MAILVLWGAIAECEPIRSERQHLEPVVYTADQEYFITLGLWEAARVSTALERTIDATRKKSQFASTNTDMVDVMTTSMIHE